jgi:hypothetical protein
MPLITVLHRLGRARVPWLPDMPDAAAPGASEGYDAEIRKKRIPHARHWGVLAIVVANRSVPCRREFAA